MKIDPEKLINSVLRPENPLYKGDSYPYGVCDCDSGVVGGCCLGTGPAARTAIRDGDEIKLCTRCDLSKDNNTLKLLVTKEHLQLFIDYDYCGGMVIQEELEAHIES